MTFEMLLGVVVGLIVAWALLIGLLWILRPRGVPLREALRLIPDVLRLVRGLVTDRSVPLRVRLALVGLIVWLASPIDLIPEFVPILGPLDDIVVAVIVLRYARRVLGDAEIRRRWAGTADGYALLQTVLGSAKG